MLVSVEWLKKYRVHFKLRNPKGSEQYESLKQSIRLYGFVDNLKLVVGEDGLCRLLDGHHRLQIAEELGIQNVPLEIIKRKKIKDRGIKLEWG